eukprot:1139927-Pelagomonas_calceolata.AAC.12
MLRLSLIVHEQRIVPGWCACNICTSLFDALICCARITCCTGLCDGSPTQTQMTGLRLSREVKKDGAPARFLKDTSIEE